jgi:hypothetical protein
MTLLQSARDARRRSNRIRIGGGAVLLGALVALAAGHRTLAQNATHVSGATPDIAVRYQLAAYMESRGVGYDGSGNNGKISSSAGRSRGKRCGMSPGEFAKFYPPLFDWIRATLTSSAHLAQSVASREFPRLPLYFTEQTLASTKVVVVDSLPMPPLSSMGLARFADFERGNFDGITYLDTVFTRSAQANNENIHFHELVHVIQWRLLGPEHFLFSYANGLECVGYRQSPMESMAYDAEATFASSAAIFSVEKMVAEKLGILKRNA